MQKTALFLDSGAFSAFTQGTTIDIDSYITFIKEFKDKVNVYVNLDVIGSAEDSWKNQEYMESKGLHPLPVFHLQDGIEYLHRCLKYPYFCLGGMASGATTQQRLDFLDKCWDIICDTPDRLPKSKVHGLGMTSLDLLFRFPWWSVDSSSWLATGRFGGLFVPCKSKFTTEAPLKVFVSTRSPSIQEELGDHISSHTPLEQKIIMGWIKKWGFELGESTFRLVDPEYIAKDGELVVDKNEQIFGPLDDSEVKDPNKCKIVETIVKQGLCNSHILRDHFNFVYFKELERHWPIWPQPFIKPAELRGFDLI
jgi:hypothetical protein